MNAQPAFPGRTFGFDGLSTDAALPSLTQAEIDAADHRHLISDAMPPSIARCWLLADNATFASIPQWQRSEAVGLVRTGFAVLILAEAEQAADDVLAGLLDTLDSDKPMGSA